MILTVNNYFSAGCGTCLNSYFDVNSGQLADDVDFVRGKHQMAFGVDYFRKQLNVLIGQQIDGVPGFSGVVTGDALADFMIGGLDAWRQDQNVPTADQQNVFSLYGQDSIRVSSRLTVNAGLRWAPFLAAFDKYHRNNVFSPQGFAAGTHSQIYPNAPAGVSFAGDPGVPSVHSKLNVWDPRFGIVWDPDGKGRQSIRAGGAIVHETQALYGSGGPSLPYTASISFNAPAGGFTNPYGGFPGGNPYPLPSPPPKNITFPTGVSYGTTSTSLNVQPTYVSQWNVSYQRELPGQWLLTASYLGNKTAHMWITSQIDPGVYIPGTCGSAACSTTGNTNARRVLTLQNPAQGIYFGSVTVQDMGANANYNGALISIQHRFANNFTLLSNYTWSHCIDDWDYGGPTNGTAYQNPSNRAGNRGACGYDHRHVANTSLVAISPLRNGWSGRVLGGWEIAPIISVRTGDALTITVGTDNSLTGQGNDRPNSVLPNAYASPQNVALWISRSAFAANPLGTFGNVGRDTLVGPGNFQFDASLSRRFSLREWIRLEARFEAFNVINHANFNDPATTLSSSNFGKILGAGDPRILQFAVKLHY